MSYAVEKFTTALSSMVGAESLQERLFNAFVSSLIHVTPDRDLPAAMRQDFIDFKSSLTCVPAKADEGTAHATIYSMTEDQLSEAAEKIVSMYYDLMTSDDV